MTDPIRLAIIGTGLIVNNKHWPALATLPHLFRVIAVVNRSPAKAQMLADRIHDAGWTRPQVYTDYMTMLAREQPEAVTIALPPVLNPEAAAAALAAACHVMIEKPIAANLADAAAMLPWAQQYGRNLLVAENYRYLTSFRRAAELIAQGTIGRLLTLRWSLYAGIGPDNPYYHTAWRQNPAHPGGYLSDGGVHHAAVLRLLGGEIETVVAHIAALRADLPPADTLSASLRFENGALGAYAVTYACPGPETPLQAAGAEGVLSVGRDRVELWRRNRPTESWHLPSAVDGLVAMYEDFARAIRNGHLSRSPAAEGYADLQLVVAMLRSASSGQAVKVADVAA